MRKLVIIILLFSLKAQAGPGTMFWSASKTHTTVSTPVCKFFFGSTGSNTCSGWTKLNYDPSSATTGGTNNSITLSNVATANWTGTGGTAAADGTGSNTWSGGSPFNTCTGTSNNVTFNSWFNLDTYDHTQPQLEFSGLIAGAWYSFQVTGATNFGTAGQRISGVRFEGVNLSAEYTYNPGSSGSPNTSATTGLILHIQADATGKIRGFLYKTNTDRGIFGAVVGSLESSTW